MILLGIWYRCQWSIGKLCILKYAGGSFHCVANENVDDPVVIQSKVEIIAQQNTSRLLINLSKTVFKYSWFLISVLYPIKTYLKRWLKYFSLLAWEDDTIKLGHIWSLTNATYSWSTDAFLRSPFSDYRKVASQMVLILTLVSKLLNHTKIANYIHFQY